MRLIDFLAAGVKGAESGTATFVLRGTSTSAASQLYLDFEALSQPGTNIITLDANGAAEVYTNVYVDVTVKNSAGSTLRTVTVGQNANTTEVISPSFTGTDYSGSPSGVNHPVTLEAILDAWITSAGSADWKVLVGGVATNLSTALASSASVFVNVKAQGAVGNGIADDTAAINAAIAGAAGSIVFFPPGTYRVSAINATPASVMLMGSGPASSIIRSTVTSSGSQALIFADSTFSSPKIVQGMSFSFSSASASPIVQLKANQSITFRDCLFDLTNCSSAALGGKSSSGQSSIRVSNCVFTVGASSAGAINKIAVDDVDYELSGCRFTIASGFTGTLLNSPGVVMSSSTVDASANASAHKLVNAITIGAGGLYKGSFSGNTFIGSGSTSQFCFDLSALVSGANDFCESGNTFSGFVHASTFGGTQTVYNLASSAPLFSTDFGRLQLLSKASVFGARNGSDVYTFPSGEMRFRKSPANIQAWEDFCYIQTAGSATAGVATNVNLGNGNIAVRADNHGGLWNASTLAANPGILTLFTGANAGDQIAAHLGVDIFFSPFPMSAFQYLCFIAKAPTITSLSLLMGFFGSNDQATFTFSSATTSTIVMNMVIGGASQTHDTGLSPGTGFNKYEIFRENGNLRFALNGANSFTMTGAPSGLCNLFWQASALAASSRELDLDYYSYDFQLSR